MTKLCWVNSGDSISASSGRWPFQYLGVSSQGDSTAITTMVQAVYHVGGIICKNCAVSGTRLADTISIAPTYIDPIVAVKSISGITARKYLFTCAIGSNDGARAAYATATLYAAAVASMAQSRRTAGFDLIALATLLPRGDGTMNETDRLEYNSKLMDSAWRLSNGVDYVFDLAGEATIGNPANVTNTTYYLDLIHPTDTGSALLATNQVAPIMSAILAAI